MIAGCDAVRPDIAGIMGAFGAALIARERYVDCEGTTMPVSYTHLDVYKRQTPGNPGILSEVSPINAFRSINSVGVT